MGELRSYRESTDWAEDIPALGAAGEGALVPRWRENTSAGRRRAFARNSSSVSYTRCLKSRTFISQRQQINRLADSSRKLQMNTTNTAKKSLTLFRKDGRIRMNQSYTAPQMPYTDPPGLVECPPRHATASRDFFCPPFSLYPIAGPLKRKRSSSINYFALRKNTVNSMHSARSTESRQQEPVTQTRQKSRALFALNNFVSTAGRHNGRPRRAGRLLQVCSQLECGAGQISRCGISRTVRIHYIGEISSAECKHNFILSSRGNING